MSGEECGERPVYVSTACLPGVESLASRLRRYHEAGLDHVELGAGVEVEGGELRDLPPGSYLIHNYFPPPEESFVLNLASPDGEVRRKSQEMVLRALELSASLEAPFYSVHAGFITDPVGWEHGSFAFPAPAPGEAERALDRFIGALRPLTDEARRRGVGLLVENNVCIPSLAGKLLLQTTEEFEEFLDRMDDDTVRILLDTGHLNVSATTFGFSPGTFVDRLASRIGAFHVHDNDGSADQHRPAHHSEWVLAALRDPRCRVRPIIVEARCDSVAALAAHVEWLGSASAARD